MIRPDPKIVVALAQVSRQYPEILDWLGEWRIHELNALPNVVNNVAQAQGRCQVLKEVHDLLSKAPDMAAQPRR